MKSPDTNKACLAIGTFIYCIYYMLFWHKEVKSHSNKEIIHRIILDLKACGLIPCLYISN